MNDDDVMMTALSPSIPVDVHLDPTAAMEHLVEVVQHLSLARDLGSIMKIVRSAARVLTGAHGATFILRDGDQCFYADEDAQGQLWKGSRFPLHMCVSGWVMLHRQPVIVEDIYEDARIPTDAYRPTFVRSLAMVPIRAVNPVGAIGNYWASHYRPTPEQMKLLQALADTTAVAMESVRLHEELEKRVKERTAELEAANREIRQLSLQDELTSLYNRRGFVLLATQQLRVARQSQAAAWLLFADVDGLKQVNDRLGHEAGDRLIVGASQALRDAFREYDIVARIGGDEFVVFGVSEQRSETLRDKLVQSVGRYNAQSNHDLALSMSTGLVRCEPAVDTSLEDLLSEADEAMYEHKRMRANQFA